MLYFLFFFSLGFNFAICVCSNISRWSVPRSKIQLRMHFSYQQIWILKIPDQTPNYHLCFSSSWLYDWEYWFPDFLIVFIGPESDHWLCLSLTNSVTLHRLYWCDPGVYRCQLNTCWGCYCCWCWWWELCWQQFVADLEAEVWFIKLQFCSNFQQKVLSRFWV